MERPIMKSRLSSPSKIPKTWAGLAKRLPLRPIRDDVGYRNAQEVIDALVVFDERTRDQEDYLDSLTTLFDSYEQQRYPMAVSKMSPLEALKFLLEEHGMSGSDLGHLLGQRTLGPAILRGERQLSKNQIRKLSSHFAVSAEVFL